MMADLTNVTKMMQRMILPVFLGLLFAGCLNGPTETVTGPTSTEHSRVGPVADALVDPLRYTLVSVSVRDRYVTRPSGLEKDRFTAYSYYSVLDGAARTIAIDPDGKWTNRTHSLPPAIGAALAALTDYSPTDSASLTATLSLANPLLPKPSNGLRVNYWISAIGGAHTLVFTSFDEANLTSLRRIIDIPSGTISLPTGTPATPGFRTVDRLDIPETDARAFADAEAALWDSSARLFMIATREKPQDPLEGDGAFIAIHPFGTHTDKIGSTFYPPDMVPADGETGVWGFLYYSSAKHELLPIYVYSGMLAIAGLPVAAPAPPAQYLAPNELTDVQFQPAANATSRITNHAYKVLPVNYYLSSGTFGPVWRIEFSWREAFIMYATPGSRHIVCPEHICD